MVVGSVELVPLVDAVGLLGELDELYPGFDDWEPYRALYPELFAGSQWRVPCTSYLIRSGGKSVLVDTGVGPAGLWGWTPEREEGLLPALAAEGVALDEVDVVFLTHLHVDHVGWNTDRDGGSSSRRRATSLIATVSRSRSGASGRTSGARSRRSRSSEIGRRD